MISSPGPEPEGEQVRDRARQQLIDSLGGWTGTVITAIPPLVFVVVNGLASLRTAVIAAVVSALLLAGYRLLRKQPVQQAATGLFSVGLAAIIAARTGHARNFFVVGIASSFGYAAIFAVSLFVGRPLVGVIWEYLDPSDRSLLPAGRTWREVRTLRRAYDWSTLLALLVFLLRAVVQVTLFDRNRTGWLAIAKVAMGYPLYAAVLGFAFWSVRRARRRLVTPRQPVANRPDDPSLLGADGLPDVGLGLGQGHEE